MGFDDSILCYLDQQTDAALTRLYESFMGVDVLVPLASEVTEVGQREFDVPAICVRAESGEGMLPVFTTMNHLLEWKPQGCLYVELRGREVLAMAKDMTAVDGIVVNIAGAPRGWIPKAHFDAILDM